MAEVSDFSASDAIDVDSVEGALDGGDAGSLTDEAADEATRRSAHSPARFIRRQLNRCRKLLMCGEGYSLRGASTWIRRTSADWRRRSYPISDIRWAHAHGFSAGQLYRYDVTPENAGAMLSEREYDLLFPINGKYGKWLDDRITARMVAGPFKTLFEEMHFNIISRNGMPLFIPLSAVAKSDVCVAGGGLQ